MHVERAESVSYERRLTIADVVATVQDAARSDEEVVAVLIHLFLTRRLQLPARGRHGRAAG